MKLNLKQRQFVEGLGQDMVGWGLPRTMGLIYAYLLLRAEPASLDEIVAELAVAKSGASVAARQLVAVGLARAVGERGSRRIRYQALLDLDALFAARNAQTHVFLARMREGAAAAPAGSARRQMTTLASQLEDLLAEVPALLRRIRERRRA
ncbi:MAG TPA: ArsR family transcriptional regulator [Candidatus Limnocylindria bacterium]|nr:ArsR family transcriptional regulator [Candidatus Limnocylindria bacterium]